MNETSIEHLASEVALLGTRVDRVIIPARYVEWWTADGYVMVSRGGARIITVSEEAWLWSVDDREGIALGWVDLGGEA